MVRTALALLVNSEGKQVKNSHRDLLLAAGKFPAMAFGLALIVATTLSLAVVQPEVNQVYREKMISDAADYLQLSADIQQQRLTQQVQNLAKTRGLAQLLNQGDPALISLEEARIKGAIPQAIWVRLIPSGEAKVDLNSTPPFTFAALDLVNQVETGQLANPEAIKVNGSWLLGIAAPIIEPSMTMPQGTLFVYLDIAALHEGIDSGTGGAARLMQSVNNAPPVEIVVVGNLTNQVPVSRALENAYWTLQFYPNATLTEASAANPLTYLLPLIVALLIALAGTVIGILRFLKSLGNDLDRLNDQIDDVAGDRFQPSNAYHLPSALALDKRLATIIRKPIIKHSTARSSAPPAPSSMPQNAPATHQTDEPLPAVQVASGEQNTKLLGASDIDKPIEQPSAESLRAIFRAYDIRGIIDDTLTPAVIFDIGRSIGSEAIDIGEHTLLVGADGRLSSPEVMAGLIDGILATGVDVIGIGTVPTPVLYYATHNTGTQSGVMVTASHNPAEYNGFKIVFNKRSLIEEDLVRLYRRFEQKDFHQGKGHFQQKDLNDDYLNAISDDIIVARPLRVVVDCGNGVAGEIAPEVYVNLGCEVIPLYCDIDGSFPNHHPDPSIAENLQDLILLVKAQNADLGIALDGDGDRMVAVTGNGDIVPPDELLMLLAKDVVSRSPGSDVVYDVKCTKNLNSVISGLGGRPILCRSGHSYLKKKMAETDAALGGEFSGHICFGERWYGFDDGIYAGARLLEIVGSQDVSLTELMKEFPKSLSTPELKLAVSESAKFSIVASIVSDGDFGDGTITTIDGVRVDYVDGWGLVRASNTGPWLTLRFEADNTESIDRIKDLFRAQLQNVDPSLNF